MILSVHAVFGAAVASLVPAHPVEAFALGFVSHIVLDSVPHRDYDLISLQDDLDNKPAILNVVIKKFRLIRDGLLVSLDATVGILLAFLFFFDLAHPFIFLIGALASYIPDFLTFLFFVTKNKFLGYFYRFHTGFFHPKIKVNQVLGVLIQYCIVIILATVILQLKSLF